MSLSDVRPFFRERLEALGFREHEKPFLTNEIAANIADRSFHIETGLISSAAANQIVHEFDYPLTVRIYRVGYSNTINVYDSAINDADSILEDFLDPTVRIGTLVKDIVPNTISLEVYDASNVDTIILEMNFTAKLQLCFKK